MGIFLTIKNIFKIHPFYYVFAFISSITGNFKSFMIFTFIIFIHELGHLSMALILKWKVDKVLILPFGGVTLFNEDLNRPLFEEFLILICGPLFQLVFTYFFRSNSILVNYSIVLLIFNMLPIFPLDGSKFLNIFLNLFLSFKTSHILTLYFSFVFIFFVTIKYEFNLFLCMILGFIFFKVLDEFLNHGNIFNRFLLERYIKHFRFKKYKYIKSFDLRKMRRDCKHIFFSEGKCFTERDLLKKRFDFKG